MSTVVLVAMPFESKRGVRGERGGDGTHDIGEKNNSVFPTPKQDKCRTCVVCGVCIMFLV